MISWTPNGKPTRSTPCGDWIRSLMFLLLAYVFIVATMQGAGR